MAGIANKKILLISGDMRFGTLASRYLMSRDFMVKTVTDAETGERLFRSWNPALVVLEGLAAGSGGGKKLEEIVELLRVLRRESGDEAMTPVLLGMDLGGESLLESEIKSLGVSGILIDPFSDLDRLYAKIVHVLGARKSRRSKEAKAPVGQDDKKAKKVFGDDLEGAEVKTAHPTPGSYGRTTIPAKRTKSRNVRSSSPVAVEAGQQDATTTGFKKAERSERMPAPPPVEADCQDRTATAASDHDTRRECATPVTEAGQHQAPAEVKEREPIAETDRHDTTTSPESASTPSTETNQRADCKKTKKRASPLAPETNRYERTTIPVKQAETKERGLLGRSDRHERTTIPVGKTASRPREPAADENKPGQPELRHHRETVPKRGSLDVHSVVALIHGCAQDQADGALILEHKLGERRIFFEKGTLVHASSDARKDSLGSYINSKGLLSPEKVLEACQGNGKTDQSLAAAIISRGWLDQRELMGLLEAHVTMIVTSSFGWEHGGFFFDRGRRREKDSVATRLDVPRVIMDGVVRHYTIRRLEALLPVNDDMKLRLLTDGPLHLESLKLTTREARVLEGARAGARLGDLLSVDEERLETLQTLYALFLFELVAFCGESRRARPSSAGVSERCREKKRPSDNREKSREPAPAAKDEIETLLAQGVKLLDDERFDDAISHLRRLLREHKDDLRCHAWYGFALYLSNPELYIHESQRALTHARSMDPDHPVPYRLMARLRAREGAADVAREMYQTARKLAPEDQDLAREIDLFEQSLVKGTWNASLEESGGLGKLMRKFFGRT